jgi:hypothetical protein
MTAKHTRKATELDPRGVSIHLSEGVRNAFADLAAAVHFSEHFNGGWVETVKDLAAGKTLSADDFVGSFPMIAEQTFKHIHATGDERAAKAWREIGSELLERGFTLTKDRARGKSS